MSRRPKIEEHYQKDDENTLHFVIYTSTTGVGDDEVLQHKLMGTETSHITLHPDGTANFRIKRSKTALELAIRTGFQGYSPEPSENVKKFLIKVLSKIT
jgi:hypothetical protein